MPVTGEYEPSPSQWVRDQVAEYEESGGERANTLRDTGLAIVISRRAVIAVAKSKDPGHAR